MFNKGMTNIRSRLAIGVLVVSAAFLQACVSDAGPMVKGSGVCNDSGLGWIVGKVANEENMRRVSRESGAGLINPIGPSSIVSKDRRQDRLRVYLDEDNLVTSASCE